MAKQRRHIRTAAVTLLLGACLAAPAAADWVWNADAGWVNTRAAAGPTPEGRFKYAVGMLMKENVDAAFDTLLKLREVKAPQAFTFKVRYYLVECRLRLGKFVEAANGLKALEKGGIPKGWKDRLPRLWLRLGKAMSRTRPRRSAEVLSAMSKRPWPKDLRVEALLALADLETARREYDQARRRYLRAARLDPDEAQTSRAVFGAAWADLLYCRDAGYDRKRLERASKEFDGYERRCRGGPMARRARECAWLCRGLLKEYAAARQAVYYAVIDLLVGDLDKAYGPLKKAARKYRDTYVGEAAEYYVAEYWYMKKRWTDAFDCYEELLERYPGASRLREIVDREYEIGKKIMNTPSQWKWRSWRLANATHVFERMILHNPSGPRADDAQILIGDCYLERCKWEEAYQAYTTLIEDYPQSEWVPLARYRSGVGRFRQAEFTEDKGELLIDATRAFQVYLRSYPRGALADRARAMMKRARSREAALQWRAARLYERTDKPWAAAYVLDRLVKTYPATAWAGAARRRLKAYVAAGYLE